jgi:hypothetical protein
MGWWKADKGTIVGDAPLDILDRSDSKSWTSRSDVSASVFNEIATAYQEGLGRAPTDLEIQQLLSFNNG